MYTAYVLENLKGKHYTGSTNNLQERLVVHNDLSPNKAMFHRTTYRKGPWKIVFRRDFKTRKESLKFERYLKTGVGRKWLGDARPGE